MRIFFLTDMALYIKILYNSNMLIGFKTELNLNNEQRAALARHAGTARHAYNRGLGLTKAVLNHTDLRFLDTKTNKIVVIR
jgi:putative transposase